ncbi:MULTISPECIES: phosphoribosyl-ATP diphosphatase [unclassified Adlercreutzia]|uniref:phosphoribosyl-ATP diphosphatase n=1 Tax=unclassified Adlercreutzia TaxID=2636013 RepID=UPI0013EDA3F8|nr:MULTISPECIES: phosphoribosyl-ATP diphosphatase [unclassified Adlercreutzia]
MAVKTYVPEGEAVPASQIGSTLEALAATIAARRGAGAESYTHQLLCGELDRPLKKVAEEAVEVGLAAKDADAACGADRDAAVDHLRYEAADVVYHLMVVLERFGISIDEFAAELNNRMTDAERPAGAVRLHDRYVRRGK